MSTCRSEGWTVLEVLIVLVIGMVLAAFSYPSYSQFVLRSKRVEGQAALQLLMQQQERYFSAHNSYIVFSPASTEPAERQFKWWSGASAAGSAYEIEAKACDDDTIENCVQLIASPGTSQVDANYKDDECGNLILTSTGLRLATGQGVRCWH
ncbi:pilus assembly protein PilE [Massilia sp. Root351]|uniref:type IV pilin protein n=1 Tax=Massilia sp. Root351 TaxID=1736522 RepID=UPI00070EBF55|nr:type IV pilin protein [Massilia sp. Root351]KQV79655.1 pilus assembly protein PilE [Massilia sp. Root351]